MKHRILKAIEPDGKIIYFTIQWQSWYWPFWTFLKWVNEGGGSDKITFPTLDMAQKWIKGNYPSPMEKIMHVPLEGAAKNE